MARNFSRIQHRAASEPKPNGQQLEMGLAAHLRKVANGGGQDLTHFLDQGDVAEMMDFSQSNAAMAGSAFAATFKALLAGRAPLPDMRPPQADPATCIPKNADVLVTFRVKNLEPIQEWHSSGTKTVINRGIGGSSTSIEDSYQIYGVQFTLEVEWRFRNSARETHTLLFTENIRVAPQPRQRCAINVVAPEPAEFEIGSVLDICHERTHLPDSRPSATEYASCGFHTNGTTRANDFGSTFPRHNPAVKRLEHGLAQLCRFADYHNAFLARFAPLISDKKITVAIPWGPKTSKRARAARAEFQAPGEGTDDAAKNARLLNSHEVTAMHDFHNDRVGEMMRLGPISNLVQHMYLIKLYGVHFGDCFSTIDDIQSNAFLKAIGTANADLFHKGQSTAALLTTIGKYQGDKAGLRFSQPHISLGEGYSIGIKIMTPGDNYFSPLSTLCVEDTKFDGEICLGGLGSKPIKVHGTSSVHVAVVPTEKRGDFLPTFKLLGNSKFGSCPIAIVLGTPDGQRTNMKTVFRFDGGMFVDMALQVAMLPSNKEFGEALTQMPEEMASFAKAVRQCDMSEAGFDMHVIELRPLLAHAIGVNEQDLAGVRRFEALIVGLMNSGCSIQCLSQQIRDSFDQRTGDYDLAAVKQRAQELKEDVLAQGVADHYVAPAVTTREVRDEEPEVQCAVFRSMGADDNTPSYTSLGASEPAPAAPPVAAAAGPPMSAAPPMSASAPMSEAAPATEAEAEAKKDTANLTKQIMDRLEAELQDSATVSAGKFAFPNLYTELKFAKTKFSPIWGGAAIPPGKDDYKHEDGLDCNAQDLIDLFYAYGAPIKTTRISLFAVFTHIEVNLLTAMMSGSRDPTKLPLETMTIVSKLLNE